MADVFRDRPIASTIHRAPVFADLSRARAPPPGDGRLRLEQIAVGVSPNPVGLYVEDDADAYGCRFFGQLSYDRGDLVKGAAGTCDTWFRLARAQMPAQGHYESRPAVKLVGNVWGTTAGGGPIWTGFGDNWCKCWLHTTQILRSGTAEGPIIATAKATQELIFIEDDQRERLGPLPGSFFYPAITFNLDPGQDLIGELHLFLEYQLEGFAVLRFGSGPDLTPATYRVQDWTLLPA